MTIQSQLDQVLALSEKATPGPWRVTSGNIGNQIEAQSGKSTWDGDDGMRSVAGYQYCGPSDNYIEQQEVTAANGELIAAAVNFLREHGPAIRAAVGGEAVAVAHVVKMPGYFDLESLVPDDSWPEGTTNLYTSPDWWRSRVQAAIDDIAHLHDGRARLKLEMLLKASPPATVDVGALRRAHAALVMASLYVAGEGSNDESEQVKESIDELAGLIGKEA